MTNSNKTRWIASLLLLAAASYYLWNDWDRFSTFLKFNYWFAIPLLTIQLIATLLNGQILKRVMSRFDIQLSEEECFGLTIVHAMANYLPIPQAGAITKGYYLKNRHHLAYSLFIASMLYCFVWSFVASGVSGGIAITFIGAKVPIAIWLLLVAMSLSFVALLPVFWKLPGLKGKFRLSQSFKQLWEGEQNLIVLLLNLGLTLCLGLGIYLSLYSCGHPISLPAAFVLSVGPILASLVKLTPGNLGLAEALAWMTAVLIGIQPEQAVVGIAIYRLSALVFSFLLGPFFFKRLLKPPSSTKLVASMSSARKAA